MALFSRSFPIGPLPPASLTLRSCHPPFCPSTGKMKDTLYENLDFDVDMDSQTALIGLNGVGKPTLLRLMTRKLRPISHCDLPYAPQAGPVQSAFRGAARFDQICLGLCARQVLREEPDYQYWRHLLGRYGLAGDWSPDCIHGNSLRGPKSRIVFTLLAIEAPILLLDEPTIPTNYAPAVNSLAGAIDAFNGSVVVGPTISGMYLYWMSSVARDR
jgi:ATP-binding cassette, subfamily F, member 2